MSLTENGWRTGKQQHLPDSQKLKIYTKHFAITTPQKQLKNQNKRYIPYLYQSPQNSSHLSVKDNRYSIIIL